MNCTNCGENLENGVVSCPKCGTAVDNQTINTNSQTVSFYQSMGPIEVNPIEFVNNVDSGDGNLEIEVLDESIQEPGVTQSTDVPMITGFPQVSPIPIQQKPAPQPVIGGIRPSQRSLEKKKSKKIWIIIFIILLIIGAFVGGYFVYDSIQDKKVEENKDNKKEQNAANINSNNDENNETGEDVTVSNGVVIKDTKKMLDGSLLLLVENKSSKTLGADIVFDFFNEAMKLLGSVRSHVIIGPNSERYVLITDYVLNEKYASMETKISVFDYTSLIKIENVGSSNISKIEEENKWILQYQNFSNNVMNFDAIVLFYQNNEIVYAISSSVPNVVQGNKANVEIGLVNVNNVSYGMYEIYGYAQYDIR